MKMELNEDCSIPPPTQQSTPQGVGFEGFPGSPCESSTPLGSQLRESTIAFGSVESRPKDEKSLAETTNYRSVESRPMDEESLAETPNSMVSPIHVPAEKLAQDGEFQPSKQSLKRARRRARRQLTRNLKELSITSGGTTMDSTDSTAPDHKRQRKEQQEGNLSGTPRAASLSKSGKAKVAKHGSKPKGRQSSPPAGSSSEPQRVAPAASYSSRAAGGKPLMVSLRGSDEPLGEDHVVRIKTLIDRSIILATDLDFPVRIISVAAKECKVRVSCENQETHAWVKARINEAENDFIARSPDETPPLRKFWFRMYQGFAVSSIHKLLKACNVGFPEGKLHVKWYKADGNGIHITVAAEPEMVEYLRERNFQLHCGSTVIPFRESKNRTLASRRLAKQARSSASQAAKAKAQAAKGSATPKNDNPSAATAGAEASEPHGSGATALADTASPEEAVKAKAQEPSGSGATALAAPSSTSEAAGAEAPGPSGSGAPALADSKSPPSSPPPSQSSSSPPPEATKAGKALLQSNVEPAEDAKGDPTSTSTPPLGEASPSQDRQATPIPQANQGSLAGRKASTGHQGKGLGVSVSKLDKTTGRRKKRNPKGSCSNRGR